MNSIEIAEEIRCRLNTYDLSVYNLKALGIKKGWQEKIPEFVIQIIVEQTISIMFIEDEENPCRICNKRRHIGEL